MSAPAPVAFDARALTEPVDRTAVSAFARELRAQGRVSSWAGSAALGVVVAAAIGVFMIVVFGVVFGSIFVSLADTGLGWIAVVPLLFIGAVVALIIVGLVRGGGGSIRWYRLDRFARANGMSYEPGTASPPLPGMIFSQGSSRQASDLVRGAQPRFVEFANYRYTTGSGKNRTTHRWGYVAVKLDVPLPHIVLDARGNNGLFGASNLPAAFDRHQRLSLEGDFDQYFSLYCPEGYERDALYLFTPDIMARFIDNAAALDVEIVDDWMFLYAKRDLSTLDPATWAWLFSVVAALLDKLAQWGRWRDERLGSSVGTPASAAAPSSVPSSPTGAAAGIPLAPAAPLTPPPPGVAPQGRRLKRGVSWVTVVALVFVAGWWIVNIVFDSIGP
ncbi:hypothetical protein ACTU3I_02300 [Microbacterium sp. RD1]|uniref:hypothetical protein n=1 Tax=Microbacterium sp. RD1 TaxID=3457313 RepID=UPI003FA54EFF